MKKFFSCVLLLAALTLPLYAQKDASLASYAQLSTKWVSSCPKGMDADSLSMFFHKWERYSKKVARQAKPCEYNDLYDSIVVNLHRSMVRTYEKYHKMQQGRKAMHPDELEFPVPKYMLLANKVKVDIYKRDFHWGTDSDVDWVKDSLCMIHADATLYFTPTILKDKDIVPLYVIEPAEQAIISFITEPVDHLEWREAYDRNFGQDKWDELEARENMVQNFIEIWRYRWIWTGGFCHLSRRTLNDYISIWNNGYCYSIDNGGCGETRFVFWDGKAETIEEWNS